MNQNSNGSWSFLITVFLAGLITSCDPGQSIVIENRTDAEARVEIVFSDPSGYYDFDENSNSDTLLIELDTTQLNSSREYHFGIGTWEINHALDTLAASIESIEIESWKSTEVFKGRQQIETFLKSQLTGRQNQTIAIIIE